MKTYINGTQKDISAMLVSAERYELGRQTYIVEWTCSFIANNLHLITYNDKQIMIKDIRGCKDFGWSCDQVAWMKLLSKLEGDLADEFTNE